MENCTLDGECFELVEPLEKLSVDDDVQNLTILFECMIWRKTKNDLCEKDMHYVLNEHSPNLISKKYVNVWNQVAACSKPWALLLMGTWCRLVERDYEGAKAIYLKGTEQNCANCMFMLGTLYLVKLIKSQKWSKKWDLAIKWHEKALATNPKMADSMFMLGYIFWIREDKDKAISLWKEAANLGHFASQEKLCYREGLVKKSSFSGVNRNFFVKDFHSFCGDNDVTFSVSITRYDLYEMGMNFIFGMGYLNE